MSAIEALYIFDEHNDLIIEEVYRGRPPSAKVLLPLYLAQPAPRPSLLYFPDLNPPTLTYSVIQDRLLFIAACSSDVEPLAVLEFIHRVIDAFQDFLGAPLLASKIEASYDVVAQIVQEMCDGGLVSTTEPNALKEVVETPTWTKNLLANVGLPSQSPSLNAAPGSSFGSATRPGLPAQNSNNASPVPWRRANVRHTSNEMWVDMVETLNVTVAPSGRYLSALAAGTIAFTCKVSGVPDITLVLSAPGGIDNIVSLPVFHPCVRLARWRERPGELSFVPPDGNFILAGYEVDLLGDTPENLSLLAAKQQQNINLPLTLEVKTGLGHAGADFEVRLNAPSRFKSTTQSAGTGSAGSRTGRGGPIGSFANTGTSVQPAMADVCVSIALPAAVRNVAELKASRGEVSYAPGQESIEWTFPAKDVSAMITAMSNTSAKLSGTVVGEGTGEDEGEQDFRTDAWEYDVDGASVQSDKAGTLGPRSSKGTEKSVGSDSATAKLNQVLMPSSATISFQVKGWLPSGIKVDSLNIDAKKSRGLGAGIKPSKGVKYLTVSRKGIEARC